MALYNGLDRGSNLSDLDSAPTARTNLGMGTQASAAAARTAVVGAIGTGATSLVEYSADGFNHVTIITLTAVAVAAIGDNENLAGGLLIYTLPAGAIIINNATMSVGITKAETTTDTPEVGLGTVIGSGANATLGAVGATCEDILGPAVADDTAGTAELLTKATALKIEAAGTKTVHFNFADGWADVTDESATVTGTVVLGWTRLPLA